MADPRSDAKLGMDGFCFTGSGRGNSVHLYVSETLQHFPLEGNLTPPVCFLKPNAIVPPALAGLPIEWKRSPGSNFTWRHFFLPRELRASSIDAVWFPFLTVPLLVGVPSVVTIHDISFKVLHELFPWYARAYFELMIRRAIAQANRIVAISEFTASELQRQYHVPARRIEVIHHGASAAKFSRDDAREQAVLEKLGVRQPYFLFMDGANPRKNLDMVLAHLSKGSPSLADSQIVITGHAEAIREKIIAAGCARFLDRGTLLLPGLLSEIDLDAVYHHARALLYLSLYEGFGLPILEAFVRHCPVIALRTSSLPEVAGEGALLVEYRNHDQLEQALQAVSSSDAREQMIRQGERELRRFSWNQSAAHLHSVLEEVAG